MGEAKADHERLQPDFLRVNGETPPSGKKRLSITVRRVTHSRSLLPRFVAWVNTRGGHGDRKTAPTLDQSAMPHFKTAFYGPSCPGGSVFTFPLRRYLSRVERMLQR